MSEQTQAPKPDTTQKTEANVLTTAAETIAGDNKLMSAVLKVVMGPFGLIAALCGLGYLFWKNKTYKDKIKELEKELHASQVEIKGLEKDLNYMEKSQRTKHHEDEPVDEPEYSDHRLGFVPMRPLSGEVKRSTKRKNIYLD